MANTRTYIGDANSTFQIQKKGRLKIVTVCQAALSPSDGLLDVSVGASSETGSAVPSANVIGRFPMSATMLLGQQNVQADIPVQPFQIVNVFHSGPSPSVCVQITVVES